MNVITKLFRQGQEVALPADVLVVMQSAWFIARPTGPEDGDDRFFFSLNGRRLMPLDKAEQVLGQIFPDLNPAQLVRAGDYLHAQARLWVRSQMAGHERPRSRCRRIDTGRKWWEMEPEHRVTGSSYDLYFL